MPVANRFATGKVILYLQAPLTVVAAVAMLGDLMTGPIAFGIALVLAGLAVSEGFDRQVAQAIANLRAKP